MIYDQSCYKIVTGFHKIHLLRIIVRYRYILFMFKAPYNVPMFTKMIKA